MAIFAMVAEAARLALESTLDRFHAECRFIRACLLLALVPPVEQSGAASPTATPRDQQIVFTPELIVRNSAAPVRSTRSPRSRTGKTKTGVHHVD